MEFINDYNYNYAFNIKEPKCKEIIDFARAHEELLFQNMSKGKVSVQEFLSAPYVNPKWVFLNLKGNRTSKYVLKFMKDNAEEVVKYNEKNPETEERLFYFVSLIGLYVKQNQHKNDTFELN
jgi:hypothetical protein